ncbi:MAG TPA: DUF2752 domain-containing protein [Polyangiaceae bacterium]|nr:DUF2752 domain-containing protein [Polyangiaceae bacterium]
MRPACGMRGRAVTLAAVALLGGGVLALGLPICPAAAVFGIPCPGCGLTRATLALARGHFGEALHLHPLVPLLAPLYLGLLVYGCRSFLAQAPRAADAVLDRRLTWLAGGSLVLLLLVWIARFFGYFGGPVPVQTWSGYFGAS